MGVIQNAINKMIGAIAVTSNVAKSSIKASNKEKEKKAKAKEKEAKALEKKQNQAMSKVANKQDAAQTQRRNFMNYLKDMPSSIGGKVGEMPIEIQKQIAKTYSATERKAIMDNADLQKKGGKQ